MKSLLTERVMKLLNSKGQRKLWQKLVFAMAIAVIFITAYMLMLPVIALESETICGKISHIHSDSCYQIEAATTTKTLICTEKTLDIHQHKKSCYDDDKNIICGYADYVVHTHNNQCYNTKGKLVCSLPEVKEHKHTGDCYEEQKKLNCKVESSEHEHSDECYTIEEKLICKEDEVILHTHDEKKCFDKDGKLTCEKLEVKEHKHSDDCFKEEKTEEKKELTCNKEEHVHTTDCYPVSTKMKARVSSVLSGSGSTQNTTDNTIDFGQYIISASYEYKRSGSDDWNTASDNTVQSGDSLRFYIQYNLPEGKLSSEATTITYKIPDGIKISSEITGDVLDTDTKNSKMGTFKISTDGTISITFNDTYIGYNSESDINGFIRFVSSVSELKTDDSGKATVQFGQTLPLEIIVDQGETTDLGVSKTGYADYNSGEAKYTITVNSDNGTNAPVTLNDVIMTDGLEVDTSSISVKYIAGGSTVNKTVYPQKNNNGYTLTLNQMEANSKYEITYTAKFTEKPKEYKNFQNNVNVQSYGKDWTLLEDSATAYVGYGGGQTVILEKNGEISGDKIKWTIKVDGQQQDISGWTLSDLLQGVPYNGTVTIKREDSQTDSNTVTTKLPYTFKNPSKAKYSITYETSITEAVNKAKLTPPNNSSEEPVSINKVVTPDPLTKTAGDISVNTESNTADTSWNIKVYAQYTDVTGINDGEKWYYEDTVVNPASEYFTKSQIEDLYRELEKKAGKGKFTLYVYTEQWCSDNSKSKFLVTDQGIMKEEPDVKYLSYMIYFDDPLPKGEVLEFDYKMTSVIPKKGKTITVKNNGGVNGKKKEVVHEYNIGDQEDEEDGPYVQKYDATKSSSIYDDYNVNKDKSSASEYDYQDLSDDHILQWSIEVSLPENVTGQEVTITEKLPEGMTFKGLAMQYMPDANNSGWKETRTYSKNSDGKWKTQEWNQWINGVQYFYQLEARENENGTVTITLPSNLTGTVAPKYIFRISASIDADFSTWDRTTAPILVKKCKNKVTVTSEDGTDLGESTQTQTITYDENYNIIQKTHDEKIENNVISYKLTINPDARDLLEGSDTLEVTDILEYTCDSAKPYSVNLLLDQVYAYRLDKDGKETALTRKEFSYTYKKETEGDTNKRILKATIPDGETIILRYSYKLSGTEGNKNRKITNVATLTGIATTSDQNKDEVAANISEAMAGGSIDGKTSIAVYKVDSQDDSLLLEGAQFKLYKYDTSENDYVAVKDKDNNDVIYKTDEDGSAAFSKIEYNTAYKLVEVEAPENYIKNDEPYYFYVMNSNTQKYAEKKPTGFDGEILYSGDIVTIENEKKEDEMINITILKQWQDADGKMITRAEGSINVEIWRKTADGSINEKCYDISLQKPDWKATVTDLPKKGVDKNGNEVEFLYYVKELKLDDYKVSYENNTGIVSGTITITNRQLVSYTLPGTGGSGTRVYTAVGMMFVLALGLLYIIKRRSVDKKGE